MKIENYSGETHKKLGYQFVQGNYDGNPQLTETVGSLGVEQALNTFHLLLQVGNSFASVVYAAAANVDPQEASFLIGYLLNNNDNDRPLSVTSRRLSQYIKVDETEESERTESLRRHMDWMLATPIPVSNVNGLEVYGSHAQQWLLARQFSQTSTLGWPWSAFPVSRPSSLAQKFPVYNELSSH